MNEEQDEAPKTPEWRVPGDEQLETGAYHVWKPRPLLRSVHWKPVPAAEKNAAAGSYDVFVDQRAFKTVHQHLWNAGVADEPFGFLVGDLCEDPDTGRRYVIVSAAVPSKFSLAEGSDPQIPGEAIVAMQLEVDRRRGILAGWYHRHRSGAPTLTERDLATHEKHFSEPWHVALLFITDHGQPAGACFRRTRHGLAGDTPLAFYEMVSNESLLAKGVRRSFMDWTNVETEDLIERDPPTRPDRPDEEPDAQGPEAAETEEAVPEEAVLEERDLQPEQPLAAAAGQDGLDDLLDEGVEDQATDLPLAAEIDDDLAGLPEVDLADIDRADLPEPREVEDDLPDLPEIEAVEDDLDDLIESEFEGLHGVEPTEDDLARPPEVDLVEDDLDDLIESEVEGLHGVGPTEGDLEIPPEVDLVEDDLEELPEVDLVEDDLQILPEVDLVEDELEGLPEVGPLEDDLEILPEVDLVEDDLDDLPEVDPVEDDLEGLPEVDLVQDDLDTSPAEVDELPEPGWDDAKVGEDVSLPLAADADLESFVTEIESSTPTPATLEAPDLDEVEPDWDEPGARPAEQEPEAVSPPREDEKPSPVAKSGATRKGSPRWRRVATVAAAVLVVGAIVASLVLFVFPSRQGDGEVGDPASSPEEVASTSEGAADPEASGGGDQPEGGVAGTGAVGAEPVAADSTLPEATVEDMEALGDGLLEAVSRFYGLAVAVDGGTATCADLAASYVEVEDLWIGYNVQGRARFRGRLPEELATRDERLYAGVQDVEREFTRSRCERP